MMMAFDIEIVKLLKEEYLRLCLKLEHLKEFARIDLDLLSLSVDVENVPDAKDELDKVHELVQALMNEEEVNLQLDVLDELLHCKDGEDKTQIMDPVKETESESKDGIISSNTNTVTVKSLDQLLMQLTHSFTEQEMVDAFSRFLQHTYNKVCGSPKTQDMSLRETTQPSNIQDVWEKREDLAIDSQQAAKESTDGSEIPIGLATFDYSPPEEDLGNDNDDIDEEKQYHISILDQIGVGDYATFNSSQQSDTSDGKFKTEEFQSVSSNTQTIFETSMDSKLIGTNNEISGETVIPSQPFYTCGRCDQTFEERKEFIKHHLFHERKEKNLTVRCRFCGKEFIYNSELRRHEKIHVSERYRTLLPCKLCNKRFFREDSFQKHMKTHSDNQTQEDSQHPRNNFEDQKGIEPLTLPTQLDVKNVNIERSNASVIPFQQDTCRCDRCGKTFKGRKQLRRHEKIHERPLNECEICHEGFVLKSSLRSHLKTHDVIGIPSRQEFFTCDRCGKTIKGRKQLRRHEKIHERPLIECEICHKRFVFKSSLKSHMKTHDVLGKDISMKCPLCNKEFLKEFVLRRHMLWHSKPFLCSVCGKNFATQFYLRKHLLEHDMFKEGNIVCKVCGREFASIIRFKIHMRMHSAEKIHLCNICGKAFHLKSILNTHMKDHSRTGVKVSCEVCQKQVAVSYYKSHMRVHTGEKPFKCSFCDKSYRVIDTRNAHERSVHTGKFPHQCAKCGRKFNFPCELRRHQRRHENGCKEVISSCRLYRPQPINVKCALCPKKFRGSYSLASHMMDHPDDLRHCLLCELSFDSFEELKSHVTSTHLIKIYKCLKCGEQFSTLYRLQAHKAFHLKDDPFKCPECGKSCTSASSLKLHRMYKHNVGCQLVSCEICGKCIKGHANFRRHKLIHENVREWKCSVCEKSFSQNSTLQTHMWTHNIAKKYNCEFCERGFNDKRALLSHSKVHQTEIDQVSQ